MLGSLQEDFARLPALIAGDATPEEPPGKARAAAPAAPSAAPDDGQMGLF